MFETEIRGEAHCFGSWSVLKGRATSTNTLSEPRDSCEGAGVCCYYGVFVHLDLEP